MSNGIISVGYKRNSEFDNHVYDNPALQVGESQNGHTVGHMNGGTTYNKDGGVNVNYVNVKSKVQVAPEKGAAEIVANQNGTVSSKGDTDPPDKDKKPPKPPMVSIGQMFRFADKTDAALLIFGLIFAIAQGAAQPLMIVVFGNMANSFIDDSKSKNLYNALNQQFNLTQQNITYDMVRQNPYILNPILDPYNLSTEYNQTVASFTQGDILSQMGTYSIYYCGLGLGVILLGYLHASFFTIASNRQSHRIRLTFFQAILRQEIGWFDVYDAGELNSRLAEDVNKIQDGLSYKLSMMLQFAATFVTGLCVGLGYGWKLALVILSVTPLIVVAVGTLTALAAKLSGMELKAYAKAGSVAEEVLGSIRTVVAFGGMQKECERYNSNLLEAKAFGIKKGLAIAIGQGFLYFLIFAMYSLAFWYGSKLITDEPENYTPGTMLVVFFSVLIGAFGIGQAVPNIQNFSQARGAAHTIYNIIDQVPKIDASSEKGLKPAYVTGNIEFRNVVFQYPSRDDVTVLNDFNLKVGVGQTVALVGSSGCGKSTTVQLIQRFYDVAQGTVSIDGIDIRELNVHWLRERLGVVSQEPVLFGTTIAENIRYGRMDVTDQEIMKATKEANAYDFIMKLPNKFNTLVGDRGAQLSGGQKQRIAIARALVRDPKILLLDEATSALDTESEAVVQAALDKVRMGRTTIVIAHRLSTVRTADVIVGMKSGQVMEKGTHDELMQQQGIYHQLVTSQTKKETGEEDLEDEEELEIEAENLKRGMSRNSARGSGRLRRMTSVQSNTSGGRMRTFSTTSTVKPEEEKEDLPRPAFGKIMKLNAPEWHFIMLGCFGALITGGLQPSFGVIFSEILGVFSILDVEERNRRISLYCLLFLIIGIVAFVAYLLQGSFFPKAGEALTERLRQMAFKSFIRQDMAYFDQDKNNLGALTSRLATDASAVQLATGTQLGIICQSAFGVLVALVIAFGFGPLLALLVLAFLPVIGAAGALQMRVVYGNARGDKKAVEEASKIAVEGIENMRTVATLTREKTFHDLYTKKLTPPYKDSLKKAHVIGFTYGFSQGIIFFAYAACFSLGAYLVQQGQMQFVDVYRVTTVIMFTAMSLGRVNSLAGDIAKARDSAARLFALFNTVPLIDNLSEDGEKMSKLSGEVAFSDVHFTYPTRPDIPILQGLNLGVTPGRTLALVGSSGCGKSTTVQLVERFYDSMSGQVFLDGKNISDLNVQYVRSQIGIVSQEPVLFDCSIAENIAYGDNSREISMDEIIQAARSANIHNFIQSLPAGYDTNVGDKGTQLSGGQKQRVAIARALIRNPKILLLDEATSALDTESEKVVQEALDKARAGRTCIVIAHRLSTIQDADSIAVIKQGKVLEQGTHEELIALRGFYHKLSNTQKKQH